MQKSILSLFTILLPFLPVAASAQEQLTTDKQRFSYTVGVQVGQNINSQAIEIDSDALLLGITDTVKNKGLKLTAEEMQKAVANYEAAELARISKQNMEAGTKFLTENKKNKNVIELASGLQYQVLTQGNGIQPKATDTVTVHYRGTLIDGTEFDSSYTRQQPYVTPVNGQIIQGWKEALPLMKVGSKWKVYIPPSLGFGNQGQGPIGPESTLIFEIELLSINQ